MSLIAPTLFRLALALALAPVALALAACRGPEPSITRQELRPPAAEGAPYQAILMVANKGGGEGEIEIIARLKARATGLTAAQRAEPLSLSPYEMSEVTLELRPAAPGPFELAAEAIYPP